MIPQKEIYDILWEIRIAIRGWTGCREPLLTEKIRRSEELIQSLPEEFRYLGEEIIDPLVKEKIHIGRSKALANKPKKS